MLAPKHKDDMLPTLPSSLTLFRHSMVSGRLAGGRLAKVCERLDCSNESCTKLLLLKDKWPTNFGILFLAIRYNVFPLFYILSCHFVIHGTRQYMFGPAPGVS